MLEPVALNDEAYTNAEGGSGNGGSIDFRELFAHVYRARYWVAGIIAGCLAVAIAYTLLTTRQYDGVALVEVRQEAEKVLGTESDRESASSKLDSDRFFDTQVDIVRSRSVTLAVAETLGLFSNDSFLEAMDVSPDDADERILSPAEAKRELVIETLTDNLAVQFTGATRILQIRFRSPDARLSARVANAYAAAYIRSNLRRKSDSSAYALEFLRDQLREAQVRLEGSERDALDYARRTRIVDASNAAGNNRASETPQSLITAQLVQLNEAYSTALAERIQAEEKWRRAAAAPAMQVPDVVSNLAVQRLVEQRAILRAQYQEELTNRQPDHPAVRQLNERVTEIESQLGSVANNIRRSIKSEYDVAQARETQLKQELERLKGGTLTEQNQGIQLSILRREADTNRAQYDALLRRYNQLNAESGVQANNIAVVDPASPNPDASWPNVPLNIALALASGLAFSALYLLVQSQLFDRVRTASDVTGRIGVPLLGAVPVSNDVLADARDPKSPVGEAFNVIRAGLALTSPDGPPRTAMVTSVQASEGKSSTCLSIAMAFARLGKRVLVIDLDLRRPNVHRLLGLPNAVGASAVLAGQITAKAAIQPSGIANLDIMTAGEIPPSPTELFMGSHLKAVLQELLDTYDHVLVDSAPLLALADAAIISGRIEATMIIIEAGRNNVRAVQGAVSRITTSGGHVAGAVLTKYDAGKMGYGYAADYKYNYDYARSDTHGDR